MARELRTTSPSFAFLPLAHELSINTRANVFFPAGFHCLGQTDAGPSALHLAVRTTCNIMDYPFGCSATAHAHLLSSGLPVRLPPDLFFNHPKSLDGCASMFSGVPRTDSLIFSTASHRKLANVPYTSNTFSVDSPNLRNSSSSASPHRKHTSIIRPGSAEVGIGASASREAQLRESRNIMLCTA